MELWSLMNENRQYTGKTIERGRLLSREVPAGSSILEEDSLSAILREVQEEVGIKLERSNGQLIKSFFDMEIQPILGMYGCSIKK